MQSKMAWYIIRTAQHKERFVEKQASAFVDDIYVPLLRTKRPHFGKLINSTAPLFPRYLFGRFNLATAYYKLRCTPGVISLVCASEEPCELDASVVQEIKRREINGLIVLNEPKLQPRQRVNILEGPFHGVEAVFERYLSNAERVVVLLNCVGAGNLKAILRSHAVAPAVPGGIFDSCGIRISASAS